MRTSRALPIGLLSATLLAACSAAPPGPAAPPDTPATAAPAASASAAPIASAAAPAPPAADLPPPAAGLVRRYYRIHPPGDHDPAGGTPVSIDVPPEWGVDLDGLADPSFSPCHVESPVFGHVSLVSIGCGSEGDLGACIDRAVSFQYDKADLAAAKVETMGPLRRWVSLDHNVHDHSQIHARLFAVDESSRTAVMCVMMLSGKDRAFFADYKKACESLVLRPPGQHDEPPVKIAARPRAGEGEKTAEVPNGKAVTDAALGFLAALKARDAKAASKLLPGERDCTEGNPKQKASCKDYAGLLQKHLPELFDMLPKDFEPGTVELSQPADLAGIVSVKIHKKGDDCGEGQSLMVREMNKRMVVIYAVAVAAKDEAAHKKTK
ncbi:MAG: hypothetical protein U0359_24270 [Byssovorax sp.]